MKKTQITYGTSYRIARTSLGAGFMLLFLACIVSHSSMPSFLESIVDYIQVVLNQPAIPQAAWIGFSMVTLSCYPYLLIRQKIKTQRLRNKLASDLHDDLGSLLNSVNIYTELAMIKGEPGYLLKIKESTQQAMNGIRDIIWQLDDEDTSFSNLVSRINFFAVPVCKAKNIKFEVQMSKNALAYQLSEEEKGNLYMIIKEAINNSIKYANATAIRVLIDIEKGKPVININDDGKGFPTGSHTPGNGLRNMRTRAGWLNYEFLIQSVLGTSIQLQKR